MSAGCLRDSWIALDTSIRFIDKGWKRMVCLNTPLFTIAKGHVCVCWNAVSASSAAVTWRCFEKFKIQRKIHEDVFHGKVSRRRFTALQLCQKRTPLMLLFCGSCEITQNTYCVEHLWAASASFSVNSELVSATKISPPLSIIHHWLINDLVIN